MKTHVKILCASLFAIGTSLTGHAQDQTIAPIEVGGTLPDLTFTKVTNTNEKQIRLSDYKGKVIILDFWATWCGPCIGTMPKIDSLQLKFKDDLKVIMVGDEDKKTIDEFFRNKEKQKKMKFVAPSIYNDQTLSKYFPHKFIPHSIIINKEGKVAAITSAVDINQNTINDVIKTGYTDIYKKTDRKGVDVNVLFYNEKASKPLLINEGKYGKQELNFKSVLTKAVDGERGGEFPYFGRFLVSHADITSLYQAAFGYSFEPFYDNVFRNRVIVETSKKDLVKQPDYFIVGMDSIRRWNTQNLYTYDLLFLNEYTGPEFKKGPDSIRKYQCEILKMDLEKFTGLKAKVVKRNVDCIVLSCVDSTLAVSSEDFGPSRTLAGNTGAVLNANYSRYLYYILRMAFAKNKDTNRVPLITEVNYRGPINMLIEADMTDWKSVNEELGKYGFKLIREKRFIDMLVISD